MNVTKTNKIGISIINTAFIGNNKRIQEFRDAEKAVSPDTIQVNARLLLHNPKAKIIRVSKSIIETCKLIDIESIKENINESNFDITSLFILLDNDKSGLIRVERFGSDFSFLMFSNLGAFGSDDEFCYNAYSFTAKGFYLDKTNLPNQHNIVSFEKSIFVVQLLTYLIFGDITRKLLLPKMKVKSNATRFVNNSKLNITFCDSLWKQRINTEGFKVRGHFRLQPIGEGRANTKLIWIEEFEKLGYNRKATVELMGNETHR